MAERFIELRDKIREWSNRDVEALPDTILEDTMHWAADMAYRTLRVPPLENTVQYVSSEMGTDMTIRNGVPIIGTYEQRDTNTRFGGITAIRIPGDLIEFLHLRTVDQNGRTVRLFNEKADVRTYHDLYAEKYSDLAYWTRQGGEILMSPSIGNVGQGFGSTGVSNEERVELYYYRRLPALDSRYELTNDNANAGLLTQVTMETPLPMGVEQAMFFMAEYVYNDPRDRPADVPEMVTRYARATTQAEAEMELMQNEMINGFNYNKPASPVPAGMWFGSQVPNWLVDENERVIVFGALAESFSYLQEDDQAQKYMAKFHQEIAQLNDEDVRRNASGGNVQINFNGRGLI